MAPRAMKWTKSVGDIWNARFETHALKVQPKGDGRWTWQIVSGDAVNPAATGVAGSVGAAKAAAENCVKRWGL